MSSHNEIDQRTNSQDKAGAKRSRRYGTNISCILKFNLSFWPIKTMV